MCKLKIAVISDIHGNRWALQAVLEDIKRRDIREMVNLGDCLYGPLDPAGTAQILIPLHIPTVRGNEDRIVVETPAGSKISPTLAYVRECLDPAHLEWLKTLSLTMVLQEELFLCHGSPSRDNEYLVFNVTAGKTSLKTTGELTGILSGIKSPVVLCGHDHVPHTVFLPGGKLIVNPGSVGLPAYSDDFPFPHAMETYTPHARYCIISEVEKGWQVEDIAVPYDWESAAAAALENNRPDWALWLKTGRADG